MEFSATQVREAATLENPFPFLDSLEKSFIMWLIHTTHLHGNLVLGKSKGSPFHWKTMLLKWILIGPWLGRTRHHVSFCILMEQRMFLTSKCRCISVKTQVMPGSTASLLFRLATKWHLPETLGETYLDQPSVPFLQESWTGTSLNMQRILQEQSTPDTGLILEGSWRFHFNSLHSPRGLEVSDGVSRFHFLGFGATTDSLWIKLWIGICWEK